VVGATSSEGSVHVVVAGGGVDGDAAVAVREGDGAENWPRVPAALPPILLSGAQQGRLGRGQTDSRQTRSHVIFLFISLRLKLCAKIFN